MIPVPNVIEYYDYFAAEVLVDRGFEVSYVAAITAKVSPPAA